MAFAESNFLRKNKDHYKKKINKKAVKQYSSIKNFH